MSVNVAVSNVAPEGQRNDLGVQKTEFYFMGSARKSGTNGTRRAMASKYIPPFSDICGEFGKDLD